MFANQTHQPYSSMINILKNINYTNENLFNSNLNNIEYNIDKIESSNIDKLESSDIDSESSDTESESSDIETNYMNEQFAAVEEELASIEEEEEPNNVLDVYFHGINEFMKNIPDDYKYKKTIETKCEIVKDKLFYAAPEFIGQVFYMMHTLQEFLDEKEPWYEDAWSYIENSKIEAKKMM
jgi:hypothetical protein